MNVVVLIDGREAIPVRAIPFVTGWKVSPDALVMSLGHTAECIRLERLTAHQLLAGGSHAAVLPREWDGVGSDLVALSKELQAESDDCDVTKPVWRRQSIRLLPGGVFVWKDEFEESFRRAYDPASPTGPLLIDEPRAGDLDLTFTPMIPEELRHEILAGFRCDADGRRMTVADLLASQTGHFISLREVLTRMAAGGSTHEQAAEVLKRLLEWLPDQRDIPEWWVSGPDELWVAEGEDKRKPWKHLMRATYSGLPPAGGHGERAFSRFGFSARDIIGFLAKHGIDISRSQRRTASVSTDAGAQAGNKTSAAKEAQEQKADTPPAVSGEATEQIDAAHSGATEATPVGDEQSKSGTPPAVFRPRVEWQIALFDSWLAICKTHGRKPSAAEAVKWLKNNDSSGTILNKGSPAELWWKTKRDIEKRLHLHSVESVISSWRVNGVLPS